MYELQGVRIPHQERFSPVICRALQSQSYERPEFAALETLLDPSDRVLELGAGLGFLAVAMARKLGSDRVVTVEADPEMAGVILDTFRENGVSPTLVLGAVSATGARRGLLRSENLWSTKTTGGDFGQSVPGVALATLIDEHQPTVLVVDIEGGESELPPTALPGVRAVLIEYHSGGARRAVDGWLSNEGFHRRSARGPKLFLYERDRQCH